MGLSVIGVGMGAGVTPETLGYLAHWPLSFVILGVSLAGILIIGAGILHRIFGYTIATGLLAASPGHISYIMGLGLDVKADIASLSIIQAMRVLLLTIGVPLLLVLMIDETPSQLLNVDNMVLPVLLVVLTIGGIIGIGLSYYKVPAAHLLGGMMASSSLHGSGIVTGAVPSWLAIPCFVVMGAAIGMRFSGVTFSLMRSSLVAALALTVVSIGIAGTGAACVSIATGVPVTQTLLAFAPGGVETMAATALLLDVDPAFVAAHHIFRILLLTIFLPLFLKASTPGPSG